MDIAQLLANPIVVLLGIAGGICSVIAIPLSIWLFLKSRKEKKPFYTFTSQNLIRGLSASVPELKISYEGFGQPLTNVTVSRFFFWNQGREIIDKLDIPKVDPLKLSIDSPYQILDATMLSQTSIMNQVLISTNRERKHVSINFDHLDYQNGFVLQIIHNGLSSDNLTLEGSIKGAGKPKQRALHGIDFKQLGIRMGVMFILGFFGAALLYFGLKQIIIPPNIATLADAITAFCALMGGFSIGFLEKVVLTKRLPKPMREFGDTPIVG